MYLKNHVLFFALAACVACAGTRKAAAVEIVAHRGASADAPENTLASVNLAWKRGADAVEIDVYLTRDGKIIVIHDNNTKRTTGVEAVVQRMTLKELRALDAGSWKAPRFKGQKLPTLSEVLATIPKGKRLFIEIKCGPEIVPEFARVLKAAGKTPEQTAVISFGYDTVRAVKKALPKLKVYWLSGWRKDKKTGRWLTRVEDLVAKARAAGVDGLDLAWNGPLDRKAVAEIRAAKLEFHVWTVDDPKAARRLAALGVDSITTNKPAWLRRQLAGGKL